MGVGRAALASLGVIVTEPPLLKIAMFASGWVGLELTEVVATQANLSHLILDPDNTSGLNDKIRSAARLPEARVAFGKSFSNVESLAIFETERPDLIVLAWWPYILRERVLEVPTRGILNLHPSFLPFNRGKHYNFWTIVEDTPFGVTIHFVDSGVDTGAIAWQERIDKTWEDTGETLYVKAQQTLIRLFKERLPSIARGDIPRTSQAQGKGSFHLARELEPASRIELERQYTARELLNLLRARTFPPHPGCRFDDNGVTYEVRVQIKRVDDA